MWSGDESDAFVICRALSASATTSNWIVDSGATCHMCGNSKLFDSLQCLEQPIEVSLGGGYVLQATGRGNIPLKMNLLGGKSRHCRLYDVLHVPELSYNLLSVSKAAENGKTTEFNVSGCRQRGS